MVLAGCSAVPQPAADPSPAVPRSTLEATPRPASARSEPRVDAHQHLLSPAAQALVVLYPELAEFALPPDLAQLIRDREQVSGAPPVGREAP